MENKNEEIRASLEKLKDSPIVEEEYYQSIAILCGAIGSIVSDACSFVELGEKVGEKEILCRFLGNIRDRLCQIQALSEIIEEKIFNKDFWVVMDMMYKYKNKE